MVGEESPVPHTEIEKDAEREREKQTLVKVWFVLALSTFTIVMDWVVCVLLCKAKAAV
jgi:hypothetical protein